MDLKEYSVRVQDPYYKKVFELFARDQHEIAGDETTTCHSLATVEEFQQLQYAEMQTQYLRRGIPFQTHAQAKQDVLSRMAGDQFYNPHTGIGTFSDPAMASHALIPIVWGPMETNAIYANGGLSANIIDRKCKGMVSDGVTFKTFDDEFWDADKINQLEEAAEVTGMNVALSETIRDALLQGGAICYPVFNDDSPSKFRRDMARENFHLEPGCIERWITIDRWNITYVPNYIITAEDYLRPKFVYIPWGGYDLNTTRVAMLRSKSVPYWTALFHCGWSPSDYSGYIRSLYAYQIIVMSVPIMAQQMSLLLFRMPLDALQAGIGPNAVKEMMKINEEKMSEWSIVQPKATNMIGEVETVERTFAGFEQFVDAAKEDIAAQCGIPKPSLFHVQNKGFSDNTQQALLKNSEYMRLLQREMEIQLGPLTTSLIAHVWGTESEEWKQRARIYMSFDKPIVSTEVDKAEIGARYAATIASMATAGIPPSVGVKLAAQFFDTVEIEDEDMNSIEEEMDRIHELEEKQAERPMAGGLGGSGGSKPSSGAGHSLASPGNAGNTGKMTKPTKRVPAK